jgi:hypothetical protein
LSIKKIKNFLIVLLKKSYYKNSKKYVRRVDTMYTAGRPHYTGEIAAGGEE